MFIFGDPGNENENVTDLCLRARVEKQKNYIICASLDIRGIVDLIVI